MTHDCTYTTSSDVFAVLARLPLSLVPQVTEEKIEPTLSMLSTMIAVANSEVCIITSLMSCDQIIIMRMYLFAGPDLSAHWSHQARRSDEPSKRLPGRNVLLV